ncbi:beta-amylase [Tritrichomonas musculus]|uniref:Beta-amylase n=1 Tax=Tritrichomonas musculus TaxID=1915356 RepID=A0ABR2H845_9EUKA
MTVNKSCKVYVMAPLDILNNDGLPTYLPRFTRWCKKLKEGKVDGVMIDVWWGLVESKPRKYKWEGYDQVFKVIKDSGLEIVTVLSFHQCAGNIGDTVNIPIPKFVFENDVKPYFVDKFKQTDNEYISFAYDNIKIGDRTPLEMYRDFMANFRDHFKDYLDSKVISEIEVGLGPCGELRYPSYLLSRWEYPFVGTFQCYDEQFKAMFKKDAEEAGHPEWRHLPRLTGKSYKVTPRKPKFWRKTYKTEYGKFFLSWYEKKLIEHGRNVLKIAREVFPSVHLSGKISGIHWLYLTESRAAEATAGFYNSNGNDGYGNIAKMFKEFNIALCFTCLEMRGTDKKAKSEPASLVQDVLNAAKENGLNFEGENAIENYDWNSYNQIISWTGKGLKEFTFLRMTRKLMDTKKTWSNFQKLVEKMHSTTYPPDDYVFVEEEEEEIYEEEEEEEEDFSSD